MTGTPLRAPFPWFGGKSRAADLIWSRFGDVANYIDPFAGSLAVLLARPTEPKIETVNDLDCYLANFWRSVKSDPAAVAAWADWPINEADLHARHKWLVENLPTQRALISENPDYYDPKIAGLWVWGQSTAIMGNWLVEAGRNARPALGPPQGVHATRRDVHEHILSLASRLRHVRVLCGDWSRAVGSTWDRLGIAGILLDPPYLHAAGRDPGCYRTDSADVATDVRVWAVENGDRPGLRIALCGYEEEHEMPASWECVAWKAPGGMDRLGEGRGNANRTRERIWFSPGCLRPDRGQMNLLTLSSDLDLP